MDTLDFISVVPFRQSLEADYREMQKALSAGAWKAVQVLAGSIVEALLVDYLASTPNSSRGNKDPLKYDLAEAIAVCRTENAISPRTADLCSVVRSYRNLIHPGRAIRTGEAPPSSNSAQIAVSVVELIIEEIARVRRQTLGLTAEQIASKIERDPDAVVILKHLLSETTSPQLERLLLEILPTRYEHVREADDPFAETAPVLRRLSRAYRIVVDASPPETRRKAAEHFVTILRAADGDTVTMYSSAFFKAADVEFVQPKHQAMVRQHLLGRAPPAHDAESMKAVDGIGRFLEPPDVPDWLDPFVKAIISPVTHDSLRARIHKQVAADAAMATSETEKKIDKRLDDWIRYLQSSNPVQVSRVESLKAEVEANRLPF